MIKALWLPLTPFTSGALKRTHPQTHKRPTLLMGKSLSEERGDVVEDSHETYFFVPWTPTIHTLMALSKKINRNTYDSRASFQHTTDTIEHSEKSVPFKYGTQVKTAHLKRPAVMAGVTHPHTHISVQQVVLHTSSEDLLDYGLWTIAFRGSPL